jgi:hypothetical protein
LNAHITNADDIPVKHHMNFNHKWSAKNCDKKRSAVRKIKAYPMNLMTEIEFAINDTNNV